MTLPKRANGVVVRGPPEGCASMTPALLPRQRTSRTCPWASITALIPVGVERMTGNSLLGRAKPRLGEMLRRTPGAEPGVVRRVEDEVGRLRWSTTSPEKMIS